MPSRWGRILPKDLDKISPLAVPMMLGRRDATLTEAEAELMRETVGA